MPAIKDLYSVVGLPKRSEIMDVPVDPWTMRQTVDASSWLVSQHVFAHLMGVNADKLLQMKDDPWMDACVRGCEVINADGASMVLASRLLGNPVPERVAGVDLMHELCGLAAKNDFGIYLLGAKKEVVERASTVLQEEFTGLRVVGWRDGYFDESECGSVLEDIEDSAAQIVFVGITSPKKEHVIESFRDLGATAVFVGVGGTFDVVAGNVARAPLWMQAIGMEWLFRLLQEPKRLLKRYVVGNTRFMGLLLKELFVRRGVFVACLAKQ